MHTNTLTTTDTKYLGMWILQENGHYWIQDERGCDEYFGMTAPTSAQIDAYAKRARGW